MIKLPKYLRRKTDVNVKKNTRHMRPFSLLHLISKILQLLYLKINNPLRTHTTIRLDTSHVHLTTPDHLFFKNKNSK